MLHTVIDETLELLTADELSRLYWSVDVWERAGQMSSAEAVTWRERISIWQRFRLRSRVESPEPVACHTPKDVGRKGREPKTSSGSDGAE